MFDIAFRPEALEDLARLRKYDQQRLYGAIATQLRHQPTTPTRNRKRLRPNPLAEWELRVGEYRVFYDVDEQQGTVEVIAVGYKQGGKLFLRGKETSL